MASWKMEDCTISQSSVYGDNGTFDLDVTTNWKFALFTNAHPTQ
jgi:hypothetical protein